MITTEINEEYINLVNQLSDEYASIYGRWATLVLPDAGKLYCFMCDVPQYDKPYLSIHGDGVFTFNGPPSIYFPFTWRGMEVCLE